MKNTHKETLQINNSFCLSYCPSVYLILFRDWKLFLISALRQLKLLFSGSYNLAYLSLVRPHLEYAAAA